MALLVAALPALATPAGAAPSPTTPSGAASAGIAPDAAAVVNIAVPALEWGALFERRSGWTGADGIYSIPLSGNERPGSGAATRTFFTFSDTFIGQVNAAGERVSGATLVNNTNALLAGSDPDPAEIDFFWRTSASGSPMAQVIPQPPTGTRTWFWPNDGIVVDGRLYLFSLRNLYVYGVRNDSNNKKLVVARVLPGQIANFSAYRFWSSGTWSTSIAAATPVTGRISSEFSVSPLPDGRYILVFQLDTLSNKVAVRYADTPVGPWSDFTVVYTAPESGISPNTYTYNAKAHPHLSTPDRLLISYNVNTFDFFEHFSNADIYRPRFIWLPQS